MTAYRFPLATVMPRFSILIALLAAPTAAFANPAQEKAIDQLAAKHGITAETPGVAIAIIEPGKPTVQKCYGLANVADRRSITPQTTFELASCSKPFTATMILILHDRGLLSVEDDIRKYVPEIPAYRPNKPIRIRDLLRHTSGLPEYFEFDDPPFPPSRKFWTNEDYVPLYAAQRKDHPTTFAPGAKYDYCNSNYMLLAATVARVTKKPFATVMQEEIFRPLEMNSTFVFDRPAAAASHKAATEVSAVGYGKVKGQDAWRPTWGLPPWRNETQLTVGDGAVWTNLYDMEKWDAAVRARKFLKAESWKAALAPGKTADGETNDYCYGWDIYREDDGTLYGFGHDGDWGGFLTSYYMHLTTNRSYVILSNRGKLDTDKLGEELIDAADAKPAASKPAKKKKK